jgi:hypothetical protein
VGATLAVAGCALGAGGFGSASLCAPQAAESTSMQRNREPFVMVVVSAAPMGLRLGHNAAIQPDVPEIARIHWFQVMIAFGGSR